MKATLCYTLSSVCLLFLSACASSGGSGQASISSYPTTSQKSIQKVETGRIVAVRNVKIEGRSTGMGAILGGAVGAAAGSVAVPSRTTQTVTQTSPDVWEIDVDTNSHERSAAMIVGGAAGAAVGNHLEKVMSGATAQEMTIALESGETVTVVQKIREPHFEEDEEVQVCTTYLGNVIVYHDYENMSLDPDTNAYLISDEELGAGSEQFEPVTW